MINLADKTDDEIHNFIKNYETHKKTETNFYRELIEDRTRRAQSKKSLNFEKSLAHLKQAAIAQKCTNYVDLAKASNIDWSRAHHMMNRKHGHVDGLLDLCFARGLPMLTAICVNKSSVEKGELEEAALAGFVEAAQRLGLATATIDKREFHIAQRDACWAWGSEQPAD